MLLRTYSSKTFTETKHSRPQPASAGPQPFRPPLGNQSLQRLLASGAFQAKLTVSRPGDACEQEADRVADEIVQRKCACRSGENECTGCRKKEEEEVQRSISSPVVPATAHSQVERVFASSGRPLDAATRAALEPSFGWDFSRVRVHTDTRAAESAREINARAYTSGHRIVFGAGQYAPERVEGKRLLAHELTHVLQQSRDGEPRLQRKVLNDEPEEPKKELAEEVDGLAADDELMETEDEPDEGDVEEIEEDAGDELGADVQLIGFSGGGRRAQKSKGPGGGTKKKGGVAKAGKAGPTKTPSGCPNQKQVDDLIKSNPRSYSSLVKMFTYAIAQGDTLEGLARRSKADPRLEKLSKNKVIGPGDLTKELDILNKGIDRRKIGNCVVLITGWESPEWRAHQRRVNCDERIQDFKRRRNDKNTANAKNYDYDDWETEPVTKSDKGYESVVTRVAKRRTDLFWHEKPGRLGVYAKVVEVLNKPWLGAVHEGDCVALPVGWKDPNIGELPTMPAATGPLTEEVAEAIATVYAEQTRTSATAQEQQRFIWFSIRKRIETEVRGPSIAEVIRPKIRQNGGKLDKQYDSYGNHHYKAAMEDLKKSTPTIAAVNNAKRIALSNWSTPLPPKAGSFYFHWDEKVTPSLEKCYGKPKQGQQEAKEKECAWKWAKTKQFAGSVKPADGWSHRIRGDFSSPNERFGSMYIYP